MSYSISSPAFGWMRSTGVIVVRPSAALVTSDPVSLSVMFGFADASPGRASARTTSDDAAMLRFKCQLLVTCETALRTRRLAADADGIGGPPAYWRAQPCLRHKENGALTRRLHLRAPRAPGALPATVAPVGAPVRPELPEPRPAPRKRSRGGTGRAPARSCPGGCTSRPACSAAGRRPARRSGP